MAEISEDTPIEIGISTDKVCFIVARAREFDAKVDPIEPDPGSNPADDGERGILEDYADDATESELKQGIADLNVDEALDLIALVWLGRGDFERGEWREARALAGERHRRKTSEYLMGIPTLADFLEEGLALVGRSCSDFEMNRM
jgi:hypothetical protein